jgi:hypothetical protein
LLAREQGNLRAALEWSFSREDEIALRLARALGRFWQARWHLVEGRAWLQRALALHRTEDRLRAELLGLLGGVLHDIGDLTEAEEMLADGLRIAVAAGDPIVAARLRVRRTDVRLALGAVGESDALAECEAAVATLEAAHDLFGLADALGVLGKFRYWVRDPARRETLERAVAAARESGNRAAALVALQWLAISFTDLSPTDAAIEGQERLLAEVAGEPRAEAGILAPLAWSYGLAGRFAEARDALARSGAVYTADYGLTLEWAGAAMQAGSIELMAGDAPAAERALRPAYDALRAMADTNYLSSIAYYLVNSLCEQDRDGEAHEVVEEWKSILPPGDKDKDAEAVWNLAAAKVSARRGKFAAAERLAREGRKHWDPRSFPRWFGEALLTQAEVLEHEGKLEQAAGVFAEAFAFYEDRHAVTLAERARSAYQRLTDGLAPTR